MDFNELEVSLVYKVSSRTVRVVTQRNPVSKKTKTKINISMVLIEDLTCLVKLRAVFFSDFTDRETEDTDR